MGLECFHRRRLYILSRQPVAVLCHPYHKDVLLHLCVELPMSNFRPLLLVLCYTQLKRGLFLSISDLHSSLFSLIQLCFLNKVVDFFFFFPSNSVKQLFHLMVSRTCVGQVIRIFVWRHQNNDFLRIFYAAGLSVPDTATLNAAALFNYKTDRILCSRICACNHMGRTKLNILVNESYLLGDAC